MDSDRVWVIEDPDERPRARGGPVGPVPRPQKSPAVAFSLSILTWGGGQLYNRQGPLGVLLILLMANFYFDPILIWVYREPLVAFLQGLSITTSEMLAAIIVFYFFGLFIWLSSAEQAYHRTNTGRTRAFRGIDSAWIPAACSLVIPGWGQFLNGQAEKGALCLLVSLLGFLAVPTVLVIWLLWPELETATDRLRWEKILVGIIFVSPMVLLIWPLNWFDALKVSLDETKKDPVIKRLEYANNRRRMYGWGRGVFPYYRQTLMFALGLVLCSTIAYFVFPHDYYVASLQRLQVQLAQQHLVLIPRLIDRLLDRA